MYNERRVPPRLVESLLDPSFDAGDVFPSAFPSALPSAVHRTPKSAMADRIFNDPQSWSVSSVERSYIHGDGEAGINAGNHVESSINQANDGGLSSHGVAGADDGATSTRKRSLKCADDHRGNGRKRRPTLDEEYKLRPFESKYRLFPSASSSSSTSLSSDITTPVSGASLTSVSDVDTPFSKSELSKPKWEGVRQKVEGDREVLSVVTTLLEPSKTLKADAVQRMSVLWSHQNLFRALSTPGGEELDPDSGSQSPVAPWASHLGSSEEDYDAADEPTSMVLTRPSSAKRMRTPPSISPLTISTTRTTTTTTVVTVHSPDQSPASVSIVSASTTWSILDLYGDSPKPEPSPRPLPTPKILGHGNSLRQKALALPKTSGPDATRFQQSITLPKTSGPSATTFQASDFRNIPRSHLTPKSAFATKFSAKQLNSFMQVPPELPTARIVELPEQFVIPPHSSKVMSTSARGSPYPSPLRITMTKVPSPPVPSREVMGHRNKKSGKTIRPLPRLPRDSSPPPPVPSLPTLPPVPTSSGSAKSSASSSASSTASPPPVPPVPAPSFPVKPLPPSGPRSRSPPPPFSATDPKTHAPSPAPRPAQRLKSPPPPLPLFPVAISVTESSDITQSTKPSTSTSTPSDVPTAKKVGRRPSISLAARSRDSIILSGNSITSPPRHTKSMVSPPRATRKDSASPAPTSDRSEGSTVGLAPRKSVRKSLSVSSLRPPMPDVPLPDAATLAKRIRKGSISSARPPLETSPRLSVASPSRRSSASREKLIALSRSRSSSASLARMPMSVVISDSDVQSPPHSSFSPDNEPSVAESLVKGLKVDFASALSPPMHMVNEITKGIRKASSSSSMRSIATLFSDMEASLKGHKKDTLSPRPFLLAAPDAGSSFFFGDSGRETRSRQTSLSGDSRTSSPAPKDASTLTQEAQRSSAVERSPEVAPPASPQVHIRNLSAPLKPVITTKGHKKSASAFTFKLDAPLPDATVLAQRMKTRKGSFSSSYRPPFEDLSGVKTSSGNKEATSSSVLAAPGIVNTTSTPELQIHKKASSSSSVRPGTSSSDAVPMASHFEELSGSFRPGMSSSASDGLVPLRVHRKNSSSASSAVTLALTSAAEAGRARRKPSISRPAISGYASDAGVPASSTSTRPAISGYASDAAIPVRTHTKAPSMPLLKSAMSVPVPDAATLAKRFKNKPSSNIRRPIEASGSQSAPEELTSPDTSSASQSSSGLNEWNVVVSPPTPAADTSSHPLSGELSTTNAPGLPSSSNAGSSSGWRKWMPTSKPTAEASQSKTPVPFPRFADIASVAQSNKSFEPDPRTTVSATLGSSSPPQPIRQLPSRGSTIPGLEAPRHARSRSLSPARMAKLPLSMAPPVPAIPENRVSKEKPKAPVHSSRADSAPEGRISSPLPPPLPTVSQTTVTSERKNSTRSRAVSPAPPIMLRKEDEGSILKVVRSRSSSKSPTRDGSNQKLPGPRLRGRKRSVHFSDDGPTRGRSVSEAPTSRGSATQGRSSSVVPSTIEVPMGPPPPIPAVSGETSSPSSPRGRVSPFPTRPLSRARVVSSSSSLRRVEAL